MEKISLEKLAKQYGTPLYVYSAQTILDRYHDMEKAFSPIDHKTFYSIKANSNLGILRLLAKAGAGFNLVSGGELFRALKAGAKGNQCMMAGVAKTMAEIEYALKNNLYCFTVESEEEVLRINAIAKRLKKIAGIAFRVNPNVDAKTHHAKTTTGTYENKFGIMIESIPALASRVAKLKNVRLLGLHMHLGSAGKTLEPIATASKMLVPLIKELRKKHHIEFFNIGGGIYAEYPNALASGNASWWRNNKKAPTDAYGFAKMLLPILKTMGVKILLEPGRNLVVNAGILLSEVQYTKKTGTKNFVMVDAGMQTLIRPAIYDAFHEIVPVKPRRGKLIKTDVVGPICESSDVFSKDRPLPPLQQGDLVAIMSAGAYGMTMASHYNAHPLPPEIMVHGSKVSVVRRRETYQDLVRNES